MLIGECFVVGIGNSWLSVSCHVEKKCRCHCQEEVNFSFFHVGGMDKYFIQGSFYIPGTSVLVLP